MNSGKIGADGWTGRDGTGGESKVLQEVLADLKMMHKTFFKDTDKMCDFNRSFVSGRCYLLPFLAKV